METHDEATGQVYVESSTPVQSMLPTWSSKSRGRTQDPSKHRNSTTGASSLYHTAMRSCVWYLESMTKEHFEDVKWLIAKRIWTWVEKHELLTFNIWTLFKSAYPEEIAPTFHQLVVDSGTQSRQLPSVISRLNTIPFKCLTFLSISDLYLDTVSFMSLLNIPNLVALRVLAPGNGYMDDRAFRDWTRAAAEKKAFTSLQVLLIRCFRVRNIEAALASLTAFPVLSLVTFNDQLERVGLDDGHVYKGRTFCGGIWKCLAADEINPLQLFLWCVTTDDTHKSIRIEQTVNKQIIELPHSNGVLHLEIRSGFTPSATGSHRKTGMDIMNLWPLDSAQGPRGPRGSTWFSRMRLDPGKPQEADSDTRDKDANPPSEKRKLRNGKQQNLGALLGSLT